MKTINLLWIKKALFLAGLAVAAAFVACATSTGTMPTVEQLSVGNALSEGADKMALMQGRALAVTECSACHRLYWPDQFSPRAWPGILRKMGREASLSHDQIKSIELYYVTASRAARNPTGVSSGQ